ncbi:MAG: thrombospondin type 3 repeat-containing protein [Myxococcota bacterium]
MLVLRSTVASLSWLSLRTCVPLVALSALIAGCSGEPGEDTPTASPTPVVDPTPTQAPEVTPTLAPDADGDGVADAQDNCVDDKNTDQKDADDDGAGDACDACPNDAEDDADGDGVCGDVDVCPDNRDPNQLDADDDGDGDACDTCPNDASNDADKDGVCGDVDVCPNKSDAEQKDTDSDGVGDACDNCADVDNADQADSDKDGAGDVCDACMLDASNDADGDGFCANVDNCPNKANPNQMDRDQDTVGDECDPCPNDNPDNNADGECGDPAPDAADNADFFIYGSFPDEGYQKVQLSPTGRIYFSKDYSGDSAAVHVTIVDQYSNMLEPPVTIRNDEALFYPSLQANTDYCLLAEVDYQSNINGRWPLRHVACFTTRQPCGTPINIGYETEVVKLGSSPGVVSALNASIQQYGNDYPVALVFVDTLRTAAFPLSGVEVVLGAYKTTNGVNELRPEGYTSTFESCSVSSSGAFNCSGPSAIFPLYIGTTGVNLYVSDANMTSTTSSSGNIQTMTNFILKGYVTEDNVKRIESETGITGISNLINYDLNIDDDRQNEAATFEVKTKPQPLVMTNAECAAP